MGCVKTITATTFPNQSSDVGKEVNVFFHYDTSKMFQGTVVRDDMEEPFDMIIHVQMIQPDGRVANRYIRASECQYSFSG